MVHEVEDITHLCKDELGVCVLVALLFDQIKRERTDLFDTGDGDLVVKAGILPGLGQGIVDFPCAEAGLVTDSILFC